MSTTMIIDRTSPQKLYIQMYSIILEMIRQREWPAGSQIPTEDDLCRSFHVSKATVRTAIGELVRNGYLRKQQGKGTFVTFAPQQNNGITMKTRLSEDMFGEGVIVRKEVLIKEVQAPPDDVRSVLRTDGSVLYFLCKRIAEGEPVYIEESFIPLDRVPGIEEKDVGRLLVYEVVQNGDHTIRKVVQSVEIGEARGDAAAVLKAGEGTPVLLFHRLLVGPGGDPIAYTRLMGPGRKHKLQTELVPLP